MSAQDRPVKIFLSGNQPANDYCAYDYYFKDWNLNNLKPNDIHKFTFNFRSHQINIYFDSLLISMCTPKPYQTGVYYNCKATSQLSSNYYGCFGGDFYSGFSYEGKIREKYPIYAGRDYDYGSDKGDKNGRVRRISVYDLGQ